MNKFSAWLIAAIILMIGFPWLAVTFAGSAGMAVCVPLFFEMGKVHFYYIRVFISLLAL